MATIVGVHGIGQQNKGEHVLQTLWQPALLDGLNRVDRSLADTVELACAFYGDLFRPKEGKATGGDPPYEAADVDDPFEQELLEAWAAEAERAQGGDPEVPTKARVPRTVQGMLNVVSGSRFFVGLLERALIADLKQVRLYFKNAEKRAQIQGRLEQAVGPDTRVLIGHSLGSVVAYEALCAHPEWPVRTLVTLGSPLGIRNLIFDRLLPPPERARGVWPASVERWTNVADGGDIVALVKSLASCFGDRIRDELIHNGATAHDIIPYLTAEETGRAVAAGLER